MPNLCVQFPSTSWVSHFPHSMPHFSFYAFGIIGGRLPTGRGDTWFVNFERIFMERQVNFGCQKMSLKTHISLIIGKAMKEKPPREREVHNSPLKIDVFSCFIFNLII